MPFRNPPDWAKEAGERSRAEFKSMCELNQLKAVRTELDELKVLNIKLQKRRLALLIGNALIDLAEKIIEESGASTEWTFN